VEGHAKGLATEEHRAFLLHVVELGCILERIHDTFYVAMREAAGREASPMVAIIDSQTAMTS